MKLFKIFFVDDDRTDGGTLHVENGVVVSNAARVPLPNNPDGHQDISIGWERSLTQYGVIRNFSLALGFVRHAAHILRKIFYTENIERRVSMLITMLSLTLTDTKFAFNYKFLYKGDLDFSTFQDEANKVTMNIMEGGISKLLKAHYNTIYEHPFKDDPDAINVYCDGIILFQRVNFGVVDGITMSNPFDYFAVPMPELTREGQSTGVFIQGQSYEEIGDLASTDLADYRHTSTNGFYENDTTASMTVRLSGTVRYKFRSDLSGGTLLPGGPAPDVKLLVTSSLDGKAVSEFNFTGNLNDQVYEYPVDFINLIDTINERLFCILLIHIGGAPYLSPYDFEFVEGGELHTNLETRFAATYVKMFTLYDLYRKQTGKITGDPDDAVSTLLYANRNICVTCGDAWRGFESAKIRTSMSDLFESANVQFNAGMGIEGNKLTLEAKAHYFDYSNPIPLGECKSFKKYLAVDLMANTFRIGSAPQDYSDINGRQEFNNITIFSSPLTRIVKEFNLESPYRRDGYGGEYARINFDGKKTTDSDSDNDVWLVNVGEGGTNWELLFDAFTPFESLSPNTLYLPGSFLPVGNRIQITGGPYNNGVYTVVSVSYLIVGITMVTVLEPVTTQNGGTPNSGAVYTSVEEPYILKRGTYDVITGLLTPATVFNLEDMTIKRIVKNHAPWFASMTWGFQDGKMPFQTTDKNRELYTEKGGIIYDEDADINIIDLGSPTFIPVYFEIETKVPVNLPTLLEDNPAKCFSFTWEGDTYKGFLIKAGISISDNAQQVYKLLATPDNDLSKLVV